MGSYHEPLINKSSHLFSNLNPNATPFIGKFEGTHQQFCAPHPGNAHNSRISDTPSISILNISSHNSDLYNSPDASMLNTSPIVQDIVTPVLSELSNIDDTNLSDRTSSKVLESTVTNSNEGEGNVDAVKVLSKIRTKFAKNLIIGHLNINALSNKFDALSLMIKDHLDILVIGETKLDNTFPENQFLISGYKKPYRLDRNRHGGGVMIYVREDIPSKILTKHKFSKNVEAIFVEINLRKSKLLLVGTYHSTHPEYGTTDIDYFEQMGFALDVYSNYEKFLLAGDFNVQEDEPSIQGFLEEYHAKNLVKENTCFKNIDNQVALISF